MENRDLTIGEPGKVIRSYSLPLFGSMFFQQLYTLADSFVAGRFIDENALQVNLTRLKKTMASLGMRQQLVSVRGVGYRLEVPHEA